MRSAKKLEWSRYFIAAIFFMVVASNAGELSLDWKSINTPDDRPKSVAFGNGLFVAVGSGGSIVTSTDGSVWAPQSSGTDASLIHVDYEENRFVAIGSLENKSNVALYSPDGLNWTVSDPIHETLSDISYGNGMFVVVGRNGFIASSHDGTAWTQCESGTEEPLWAVTFDGTRFVAVGSDGIILQSAGGTTWTTLRPQQNRPANEGNLFAVASGHGRLVAAGLNNLLISEDGEIWLENEIHTGKITHDILFDGNRFIAVGYAGMAQDPFITTSDDGIHWSESTAPPHSFETIAFGNTRYIAFGRNSQCYGAIFVSDDLQNWTYTNPLVSATYHSVAYGSGRYVAVGFLGSIISSTDGVEWAVQHAGITETLDYITYTNGQFIALARYGDLILTSPDAEKWTTGHTGEDQKLRAVVFGDGQYVGVGSNGTLLTSHDAKTWIRHPSALPDSISLNTIAYSGGQFVAAGKEGVIISSSDAETWAIQHVDKILMQFRTISYHDGRYTIMGSYGGIYTSLNALTWSAVNWAPEAGPSQPYRPAYNLPSLAQGGEFSVALIDGSESAQYNPYSLLISSDGGTTWAPESLLTYQRPNDVAFGEVPGKFVLVGDNGMILTSNKVGMSTKSLHKENGGYHAAFTVTIDNHNNISFNVQHNGVRTMPKRLQAKLYTLDGRTLLTYTTETGTRRGTFLSGVLPRGFYLLSLKHGNNKPAVFPVSLER